MPRIKLPVILAAVSCCLISLPAQAYLDPTTGSMVMAAILGFFAAIAFTIRKYFYKITHMFRRRSGNADAADGEASPNPEVDDRPKPAP